MNTDEPIDTKIFVLPGGKLPKPGEQRPGDVGINLSVRAIIEIEDPVEQKKRKTHYMRKTLFNFDQPPVNNPGIEKKVCRLKENGYEYILQRGESVSLGLGVVVEVPRGFVWYVQPRGSTIRKAGRGDCTLLVPNATVPGDPDYRGELWAELHNLGPWEFRIQKHMVLFQLVRHHINASVPVIVKDYSDLSLTERGCGANGSTTS